MADLKEKWGRIRGEMNMEYDENQIGGYSITEIRGNLEKIKKST
ncbi:hypothetical protein [Lacrimispora sp. 38-1]